MRVCIHQTDISVFFFLASSVKMMAILPSVRLNCLLILFHRKWIADCPTLLPVLISCNFSGLIECNHVNSCLICDAWWSTWCTVFGIALQGCLSSGVWKKNKSNIQQRQGRLITKVAFLAYVRNNLCHLSKGRRHILVVLRFRRNKCSLALFPICGCVDCCDI